MEHKKITARISRETFELLKETRLSDGEEIDRVFRKYRQLQKEKELLQEKLIELQKEKKLLFEMVNKQNIMLDMLNTMTASLNIENFIAHDMNPTEVTEAALLKQEGRVRAMRNF